MHAVAAPPVDTTAANASMTLGEADLRRIETALLEAILDVRPDRSNAVDHLLDDPNLSPDRDQVEQLLVAALMDKHPNRNQALERLLGDMDSSPLRAHDA